MSGKGLTLRQKKTIQALPGNNFNVGKSMRENGFTKAGSRAGNNYARLRKHIEEAFNLKDITEDWIIDRIQREVNKDNNKSSDKLKALELLAKWKALLTDKHQTDLKVVSEEEKSILDRFIRG